MENEIPRIARSMEKSFNKGAWYGPSAMEILSTVSAEQATHRAGNSHSIIELVLHMVSWRTFAARRLSGDNNFQVAEEANFPKPGTWEEALKKLKQSQEELMEAVNAFPESRLGELVPAASHKYTFYTMLTGSLQHDIYHLGQIQLIRKSLEK